MERFLSTLGLQELVEIFKNNCVSFSTLKLLNEDELKCLVPKVGQRALIRSRLHNEPELENICKSNSTASTVILATEELDLFDAAQGSHTITINDDTDKCDVLPNVSGIDIVKYNPQEVLNTACDTVTLELVPAGDSTTSTESGDPPSKKFKTDFFLSGKPLMQFLNTNIRGRTILESYQAHQKLDMQDRRWLVEILVSGLLDRHNRVSYEMLHDLAAEIVNIFPTENTDTYYSYNKLVSKNPRGKLVDKYKNLKLFLQKNKIKRTTDTVLPPKTKVDLETDIVSAMKWLQHSNEPWNKVLELWLKTYPARHIDCHSNMPLDALLAKWPLFKHSHGYSLVSTLATPISFIGHSHT